MVNLRFIGVFLGLKIVEIGAAILLFILSKIVGLWALPPDSLMDKTPFNIWMFENFAAPFVGMFVLGVGVLIAIGIGAILWAWIKSNIEWTEEILDKKDDSLDSLDNESKG